MCSPSVDWCVGGCVCAVNAMQCGWVSYLVPCESAVNVWVPGRVGAV
jgi:hypothetical protein